MESAALGHSLEPGQRDVTRLAGFVLLAMALHALALWHAKLPPATTTPREEPRPLSVTLRERAPTAPEPAPLLPVDTTRIPDRKPQPAEPSRTDAAPLVPAESAPSPDIDPARLLRRMTPPDGQEAPGFRQAPEPHDVFRQQSLVRPGPDAAAWTKGIWKRSGVTRETRYRGNDGRQVLVRRFDNGDIQVCDRAPDDLFSQWDDELPYVCER